MHAVPMHAVVRVFAPTMEMDAFVNAFKDTLRVTAHDVRYNVVEI